ncbi:MAG: hypothetical protein Q9163_001560 [Psora crenata]
MVLRRCNIEAYGNPAERHIGSCALCAKHMCAKHVRSSLHTCPSSDNDPEAYFAGYQAAKKRHLEALLGKVNPKALESAATRARSGVPCQIPAFAANLQPAARASMAAAQCGGQNCHVDVEFADGVTWLARIRLQAPLMPPPAVQARVFLSEVATLEFLARTQVPAPQVYAYELKSAENPVGTSYILMEKLRGKPLDWNNANAEQRAKVLEQLADVYLELEKHPIPLTGSLIPVSGSPSATQGDGTRVGPFAQLPLFETPEKALGPFGTLEAAYTAIIQRQLHTLANHEISSFQVDNYLTLVWRLTVLSELVAGSGSRTGPFYLRHYDDKGDHILVDDEYNITGIIDWEFASAEAKELAFSSPCMMWPVEDFYDGRNSLAADEQRFAAIFEKRGHADIGNMVRQGRRWRYLFFLGGMPRDLAELKSLFDGLRKSFAGEEEEGAIVPYDTWRQDTLAVFAKGDDQLRTLVLDEQAVVPDIKA